MSGIILEAENAHDIEELSIAVGISSFNTVKIVPLRYFDDVIKKLKVSVILDHGTDQSLNFFI
jgi:hypothetical protein